MTDVHYLVGEPGVGKSWLMDRLTEQYHRVPWDERPRHETLYRTFEPPRTAEAVAIELGARAGKHPEGFPGTDAMSMSAIVDVHRWLVSREWNREHPVPILAEGARLAVRRLIQACEEGGHNLRVYLIVDPERAAAQRAARGSRQNESWIKGARTRAFRFADQAKDVTVFAGAEPAVIVEELRRATGL